MLNKKKFAWTWKQIGLLYDAWAAKKQTNGKSSLWIESTYCESTFIRLTNYRGFYKIHWSMGSWIHGFKHYRQQLMGKLYFAGI
jgi:hypothetical protein